MNAVWFKRFAATLGLYLAAAAMALALADGPNYASPIYPAAGIAFALCLRWRRAACVATFLGAFLAGLWVWQTRQLPWPAAAAFAVPTALGAALQAGLGRWLVSRWVHPPMSLDQVGDILRFLVLGGPVACLVNATVAVAFLTWQGLVPAHEAMSLWLTWWGGDSLGVITAAPIVQAWVGEPAEAWRPRRLTVAVPLIVSTMALVLATRQLSLAEGQRVEQYFRSDAADVVARTHENLRSLADTLQAVHGLFSGSEVVTAQEFERVSPAWLARQRAVTAVGWLERVPRTELQTYADRAQAEGLPQFQVFDREDGKAQVERDGDTDALVMRYITPMASNAEALGVNALSVPGPRQALMRATATDEVVLTRVFKLTQEFGAQGSVMYKAVRDPAGSPLRGVVFLTLRRDQAIEAIVGPVRGYLEPCLVDLGSDAEEARMAGLPGCEVPRLPAGEWLELTHDLSFAGRPLRLLVRAERAHVPTESYLPVTWVVTVLGVVATAMLGALLLVTTGRARRLEAEAAMRQAQLSQEHLERARAEAEALQNAERLRVIFDTAPIGVRFTDLKGRVLQANAAYCQLTGYSLDELRRMDVFAVTHPDDRADDYPLFAQMVNGELAAYDRQKRYVTRNGDVRWVRAKVSLTAGPDGQPAYTVGVVEDITEHLQFLEAQQARETAEAANEAKNEFLSRMSHELRTPLNSMLGFAQLLGMHERERLSERQTQWVGQIEQAGWHLLALINDVLDLSRIEAGQMRLQIEPLDLPALLHTTLALVEPEAARRGITLHVDVTRDAVSALGDATRAKQILTNMLTNAIKYNRHGGRVDVQARAAAGGTVEIEVRDTGIGMSAEQVAGLFQPFNRLGRERSEVEGTGIGLVISQRLAALMGGTLRVTSHEGQGTTITLGLERGAEAPATTDSAPPPDFAHSGYHHRRVYYIEDNEVNGEVMRGILARRPQVRLRVFTNGLDGLAAIQQAPPDLVLLDLNLPDIDGLALLQHLQADADLAGIPVVIVSADASQAQVEAGLQAGALRYLTKPLSVTEVLSTVDEVLTRQDTVFG